MDRKQAADSGWETVCYGKHTADSSQTNSKGNWLTDRQTKDIQQGNKIQTVEILHTNSRDIAYKQPTKCRQMTDRQEENRKQTDRIQTAESMYTDIRQ